MKFIRTSLVVQECLRHPQTPRRVLNSSFRECLAGRISLELIARIKWDFGRKELVSRGENRRKVEKLRRHH